MNKLIVSEKSAYGQVRFYPRNAEAIHMCSIARAKSLTIDQLQLLEKLGWTIEIRAWSELTELADSSKKSG